MQRRLFLQIPLVTAALGAIAHDRPGDPPVKGFKVEGGKDRYHEELLIMGGRFDCKVSARDTNGQLLIYDTFREEKGGPALHYHYHQDEWFYVFEGEFLVKVGDSTFHLKEGDAAFAPRRVPHAFAKISEGKGRMMVLFQPAGTMEDFFSQMARLGNEIPKDMQTRMKELFHTHGMEVVGPPLAI